MSTGAAARAAQHHIFGCRTMALCRLLAGRTSNFLVPEGRQASFVFVAFLDITCTGRQVACNVILVVLLPKKHGAL